MIKSRSWGFFGSSFFIVQKQSDAMAAEMTDKKVREQEDHVQELLQFIRENYPKAIIEFYGKKENVQELERLEESETDT